ncbi:MAG TPA: beta-ketoacyl synthase N-terminal-like domain-containing protein [Longimicrobium sp.]|nr:beta-ketoacyl synthase N-terminal-like domain-containing protein [Longimicrobium sp.]
MTEREMETLEGIAVIGMAGRFPGAADVDTLWRLVAEGREGITFFTQEELVAAGVPAETLADPEYVRARGVLRGVEDFDASFFAMTPAEAALTPPEYRLFLECAWEALESCGYALRGTRAGVFGGAGFNTYLLANVWPALASTKGVDGFQVVLANARDHLTMRVAYRLDLRGPAVTVQTACSTSLVAVHYACQSLLSGECDLAVAGGATVTVPQSGGYRYQEGGILSPDGHCRAFDAGAGGTVPASGVAVVVLKRLEDALADGDPIDAVIRGSAVNNDGAGKVGYTAPGVAGQAAVVAEALAVAGVNASAVGYVEAHGTGTALGDPIEVRALTRIYAAAGARPGSVVLGSLKSNVGHLDSAAGAAGLIKAALALRHAFIPPSLHFREPHPETALATTPFVVAAEGIGWERGEAPRLAAVSSFGMGGTNAHVVLQEAPLAAARPTRRGWHLLPLSARTGAALGAVGAKLAAALRADGSLPLADVAFTLQAGRQPFARRAAVVARSGAEAADALERGDAGRAARETVAGAEPSVVFLFPGQGAQHVEMGRGLYETEPAFRDAVDRCAGLLRPHLELDPRAMLYPPEAERDEAARRLGATSLTQPALFTIEYALATLWMEWGVRPRAMLGHSIGEYVAACLAGVFSLEDALALVALRGRLMQALPAGAMLSVALPARELRPLLAPGLAVASENSPRSCVASGPEGLVATLERALEARGVRAKRLRTSHAFHSAMMEPALDAFTAAVARTARNAPSLPFVSNLTGDWITPEAAVDPRYWASHLRGTVRFSEGVRRVAELPGALLLEVGPGQTLCALADEHDDDGVELAAVPSMRAPGDTAPDPRVLVEALGALWTRGVAVDWAGYWKHERRGRVRLPTYPFERERHWIEPPRRRAEPAPAVAAPPPAAPGDASLEWVIEEQLRLMSEQLQLVSGIEAAETTGGAVPGPENEVPLSPVQRWFFAGGRSAPHHFNQALRFEPAKRVSLRHLRGAVRAVVEHHDAFHLRYARRGAGWAAYLGGADGAAVVSGVDLASLGHDDQDREMDRRAAEAHAGLNLEAGPLLRVVLFDCGETRPQHLLIVAHHLAVDIFSWGVLLGDVERAYRRLESGAPADVPAATTTFAEWAARLQAHARGEAARAELPLWAGPERGAARPLPRDHAGGADTEGLTRAVERWLDADDSRILLEHAPREFAAQMGEIALAALAPALAEWAGGPVAIDVEGHGREDLFGDVDLSRTVGWFTSIFPVVLDDGDGGAHRAVARVRDRLHSLPGGGIGWGTLRWMGDDDARARLAALPRAEVSFNYTGRGAGGGGGGGLFGRVSARPAGPHAAADDPRGHPLEVVCGGGGGLLRVTVRYSAGLHRAETVERLAEAFLHRLRSLARAAEPASTPAGGQPLRGPTTHHSSTDMAL